MFADRFDAAQRLAKALAPYRGQNPLVLAIPRGAVPTGSVVAAAPQSPAAVAPCADEVGYLEAPAGFHAVGQFYRAFAQVGDDSIIAALADRPSAAGSRQA